FSNFASPGLDGKTRCSSFYHWTFCLKPGKMEGLPKKSLILLSTLPFIKNYTAELTHELQTGKKWTPSRQQQEWLSFCLTGLLLTGTLCWREFERMGLGQYRVGALSWMFRCAKLPWDCLLFASIAVLLRLIQAKSGVLACDDTDHRRAKTTKKIHKAHKIFDKKTAGYFNGQCLVFLVFVTDKFTFPVDFAFYHPDPEMQNWKKVDAQRKKDGIKKSERPKAPAPNAKYPSKEQLLLNMIGKFHQAFPNVEIKAVVADAAFGTQSFLDEAQKRSGCRQVVSQIKANQIVISRGKEISVSKYFARQSGNTHTVKVRGGESEKMTINSARLQVKAHGKANRFIIAVKQEGEEEYRYLVASDLTWRTLDIVQCYTLRWLVEVFFEDWKLSEGWANMAKQPDEEGSCRGVILSLLLDHALLTHPEQLASIENKAPAFTVGSLKQAAYTEALIQFVQQVLNADDPMAWLEQLKEKIKSIFVLRESSKHMNGRDLGRLEPTPSLLHHAT
ncbi:transposase, partial [Dolichospermum sp. ST_sed1]|nr:transposase [Dolichospermum sp. ST_sed1]